MSTVAFPRVFRPEPVMRNASSIPTLSPGASPSEAADLTIHRISQTHHGRTLLTLGHAAEYLANSLRYSIEGFDNKADDEAIHILLELSRSVFEDFAQPETLSRQVWNWVVDRTVRLLD
jgi:hypothetical protein